MRSCPAGRRKNFDRGRVQGPEILQMPASALVDGCVQLEVDLIVSAHKMHVETRTELFPRRAFETPGGEPQIH